MNQGTTMQITTEKTEKTGGRGAKGKPAHEPAIVVDVEASLVGAVERETASEANAKATLDDADRGLERAEDAYGEAPSETTANELAAAKTTRDHARLVHKAAAKRLAGARGALDAQQRDRDLARIAELDPRVCSEAFAGRLAGELDRLVQLRRELLDVEASIVARVREVNAEAYELTSLVRARSVDRTTLRTRLDGHGAVPHRQIADVFTLARARLTEAEPSPTSALFPARLHDWLAVDPVRSYRTVEALEADAADAARNATEAARRAAAPPSYLTTPAVERLVALLAKEDKGGSVNLIRQAGALKDPVLLARQIGMISSTLTRLASSLEEREELSAACRAATKELAALTATSSGAGAP
jgi:hypothetical protein